MDTNIKGAMANVLAPEILYLNSDKYEFVSVRSSSLFTLIGFSVLMAGGCPGCNVSAPRFNILRVINIWRFTPQSTQRGTECNFISLCLRDSVANDFKPQL